MAAGLQCDGPDCRSFSVEATGWLVLGRHQDIPSLMAALGMGHRTDPLTFCTALCTANWAYVYAMTEGPATGSEPEPRTDPEPDSEPAPVLPEPCGIGWPHG